MSSKLDYSVGSDHPERSVVESLQTRDDLRNWAENRIDEYQEKEHEFEDTTPRGRIYIARTIQYTSDHGLVQTGSAPNYFGGMWSLTTCKKGMRGESDNSDSPNPKHPFKRLFMEPDEEGIRRPKYPVFILSLSSRNQAHAKPERADSHRNWLASLAMVTHGFDRMMDYGQYLLENHEGDRVNNRLTHASGRPDVAENRGDCHVDENGDVYYPPVDHQHGDGDADASCGCNTGVQTRDAHEHIDNSQNHVKSLSEPGYWLGWTEPQYALAPDEKIYVGYRNTNGFDELLNQFESV